MSSRVSNILDREINQPTSVTIPIPDGATGVQVVIDRSTIEQYPQNVDICSAVVETETQKMSVKWAGGLADFSGIRPGRIGLWTTGRWQLRAKGDVTITFHPKRRHRILAHVDFF